MKIAKRYLHMYKVFVTQEIKRLLEYKGDFIIGIIGFLISQSFNILFLSIIFSRIPNLLGWDFNEIVFIYGFSLIPKAIDHMLFDNLWNLGHNIVRKGEFDKYLTRPINSLFYVIVEKFQADALGELIVGIILFSYSLSKLNLKIEFLKVIAFLIVIPFATLIYTAIKIATSALAFWVKRSGNITYMFYMLNDFAKYPVTIYDKVVRNIITYIIPFAFTGFYPSCYLLTGDNFLFNIGGTLVISVILLSVSIGIWNKGICVYESAGS